MNGSLITKHSSESVATAHSETGCTTADQMKKDATGRMDPEL